jgi:hypothetical protein
MFDWFRPVCPCPPPAKRWVEQRLAWLYREFPDNVFTGKPVVLPTPEFFPDRFDSTLEAADELLVRICAAMEVPRNRISLDFEHDPKKVWLVNDEGQYLPHAAGTFSEAKSHYTITLDTDELARADDLVGTIAHELAHARLVGERRLAGDEFDNELLTDLTAVFLGFGVFLANSPRNWLSQFAEWPGTGLARPEYMTSSMFGYALAHVTWWDGDRKPLWTKYLGTASRTDFQTARRYLFKTGDSAFRRRPRLVTEAEQSRSAR